MVLAMLGIFEKFGKGLVYFVGGVIIPATSWFLILRHDVSNLAVKYTEDKSAYAARFESVATKHEELKDRLLQKMDEMNRILYRLEGEVKRMR